MVDPVNYMVSLFEWNINTGDTQEIILYHQATKEIDREYDKSDISVSNAKNTIYHFISLVNKYVWERLGLMVDNDADAKNIFWKVEQIQIVDMHHQPYGYFGLIGIGNVVNQIFKKPFVVSTLQNLDNDAQEVKIFYYGVISYIIAKSVEASITNTSLKKPRLL